MLKKAKRFLFQFSSVFIRAGRLLSRDPSKCVMLARMAWWVLLVSVGVRVLSLPRLLQLTRPRRSPASPAAHEALEAEMSRLIDGLLSINLFVFKPVCWKRAIVLRRYLSLNGVQTRIVFGVRGTESQVFKGHAWLEAGNQPLLEAMTPDYTVTYAYPD